MIEQIRYVSSNQSATEIPLIGDRLSSQNVIFTLQVLKNFQSGSRLIVNLISNAKIHVSGSHKDKESENISL